METETDNVGETLGDAVVRAMVVSAATVVATYATIAIVGVGFALAEKRREDKINKK